jgi:hypothetical protein
MPHRGILFHAKYTPRGVYTSLLYSGSPAQRDGVSAAWFLTEIDGKPVHDLEGLVKAVEGKPVPIVDPIGKEGWSKADAEEVQGEQSKGYETRSFRVKMVSLELVQKVGWKKDAMSDSAGVRRMPPSALQVVTVEVCSASKVFWPTFHAKASSQLGELARL